MPRTNAQSQGEPLEQDEDEAKSERRDRLFEQPEKSLSEDAEEQARQEREEQKEESDREDEDRAEKAQEKKDQEDGENLNKFESLPV